MKKKTEGQKSRDNVPLKENTGVSLYPRIWTMDSKYVNINFTNTGHSALLRLAYGL
jgi:hypothetical protein